MKPKRILLAFIALALLSYAGFCGYMWQAQRQLIFEPAAELQTTPARAGVEFEVVHIPSGRGQLYGWWMPAAQLHAPALLYLHGNDQNIGHSHDVDNAIRLHGLGYGVLMVDYRGYGKSSSEAPSETSVYEDAEASWNYLLQQLEGSAGRGFIYGHSLGGAIGIELAIRHPEAAGLIVESSFTRMVDMGYIRYGHYLPVDFLLNQRFDSLDKVARLKVPVLFIHGTWDRNVPAWMSRKLYETAPQPKYLKLIEGGEHSNSSVVDWLGYRDAVSAFVQKYAH